MPEARERESSIPEDVHGRAVSVVGIGVLIVIALVLAACWLLLSAWHGYVNGGNRPLDAPPRAPMLESAPQINRTRYAAEKEQLLHSYQWIDRQRGIARIPIAQAMAILAARSAGENEGTGAR